MIVPHDTIRGFRGTISSPTKCLLLGLTTQFNGYQKCSGDLCGYDVRNIEAGWGGLWYALTSSSISSSNHPTFDALGAWTPPCSSVTHRRTTSRCLGSGFSCYSIPMLPTERCIRRCGWLSPPTIFPLRPPRQPARNTITGIKSKITLARVLPCRILLREDSRGVSLDHDGQSV
ncbi:hypothetical protein FA13DRAFT_1726287 [Coprinellus micaceus]|uniref:Uncharacterized protein n=1 Tax=Coprinellus micaceus TaxID=71717 RepID=A0A4Y7TSN2_COPMI|nr:hypothetical protein FA13DRAFT_1726287 [Coprinellus micaceus]